MDTGICVVGLMAGRESPVVREIFPEDAEALLADPTWCLLDCRRIDEYRAEHIPGSWLVPVEELAARLGEFSPQRKYLVYCRSGVRSLKAAQCLAAAGIEAVSMRGGIQAWCGELSSDAGMQPVGDVLLYQPAPSPMLAMAA